MDYLDVNIAALESILDEQNVLTPRQVQVKAEKTLRFAVRKLIRKENDAVELGDLYYSLESTLGADVSVIIAYDFLENAGTDRLGAFLRLFSVKWVKQRIVEYLQTHREDEKFTAAVIIDPYYTDINELPPLCICIEFDRKWKPDVSSLTLMDLSGF